MNLLEDNRRLKKGRRLERLSDHFYATMIGQLSFYDGSGIYIAITAIVCFIWGAIIDSVFDCKTSTTIICIIVTWILVLIIRFSLYKFFQSKSLEIYKEVKEKYDPIRNEYINKKASEMGCTCNDESTLKFAEKEWRLNIENGYIKGDCRKITYVHTTVDDYGDIIFKNWKEGSEVNIAANNLSAQLKEKGYSPLDVGVSDFNKKYRVFTKNPIKGRAFFSATVIDGLLKNSVSDFYVIGNETFVDCYGPELDADFEFGRYDLEFYFEQIDRFLSAMRNAKEWGDANLNVILK